MLHWIGGPCFHLPVKWLNWCQSPRDRGLLHWNTAAQVLSSLKPGGTSGVCWWMRTKPWRNNTKWCLGWQKLICACTQKAMINDAKPGNAVPPFCSSFDGDWNVKKKKRKRKIRLVSPIFRKRRSFRVHYSSSAGKNWVLVMNDLPTLRILSNGMWHKQIPELNMTYNN